MRVRLCRFLKTNVFVQNERVHTLRGLDFVVDGADAYTFSYSVVLLLLFLSDRLKKRRAQKESEKERQAAANKNDRKR